MTKEEIRSEIWRHRLRKEKECIEQAEVLYKLQEVAFSLRDLPFHLNGFSRKCELEVKDLAGLTATRRALRKALGTWTDKLDWVYVYSENRVVAEYESQEHRLVCIRLVSSVKDFPKEILGETCRFEYQDTRSLVYTCS